MNDTAITALIGTGGAGALFAFLRWAVGLWATIRREEMEAAKANSAAQRAESARMVEALLAQARSNAELGGAFERSNATLIGRIDQLTLKLDTLVEWRDRTPVEIARVADELPVASDSPSERRKRLATAPRGYRPPKPGNHND